MAEDNGKLEEFMYDFAWRGRDAALQGINALENKAMNIVNFSGVLIAILAGVLFYINDNGISTSINIKASTFIFTSIIFFIMSILFAFGSLWPQDYKIISIKLHFDAMSDFIDKNDDTNEINTTMGKTACDISEWQDKLIKINNLKKTFFRISCGLFVSAVILILISVLTIL